MLNNLIKELNTVLPHGNVLSQLEERYVYTVDASDIKGEIPDAVVFPTSIDEVQQIIKIANAIFILSRIFSFVIIKI